MTKQYIPLTTVLENYKTELSEVGVYNLVQLVDKVRAGKIVAYYPLSCINQNIKPNGFPLGNLQTGRYVNGGRVVYFKSHQVENKNIGRTDIGVRGAFIKVEGSIGEADYSKCLDIQLQNNQLSFTKFKNNYSLIDEIVWTITVFKINNIPLFINKNCADVLEDISNCQDDNELIDKILSISEHYDDKCFFSTVNNNVITDTADNFYLLRDDVEQWVGENTQSNLQQGSTNIIRSQDIIIDFNQLSNLFRRKTAHIKTILSEAEKYKSENNTITYREILDLEWKGGGFEDDTNRTFKELFLNRVNNLINL